MKLLVPTAGLTPARHTVEYVAQIACSRLRADIVVLHVYSDTHSATHAHETVDIFADAVANSGIGVQSRSQRGSIAGTIVSVAEDGEYALIIMGASRDVPRVEWISMQVLHTANRPVVVIPHALPLKGTTL